MRNLARCAATILIAVAASSLHAESLGPLKQIERALGPYINADDPLGLPMKVRAIRTSEYKFWRGTKDLYFDWCKHNCADWFADADNFVIGHGDPHLGNIGRYAAEGRRGRDGFELGFGFVDFDDSARVPFQTELLQGMITFELIARQNGIPVDVALRERLTKTLLKRYKAALNSQRTAARMLEDDPIIGPLLNGDTVSAPYAGEVDKFTKDGRFVPVIRKKGEPTDLLQQLDLPRPQIAAALAEAATHDERLERLLGTRKADALRPRIRDAARRVRIDSSGSQGLAKYLILVAPPTDPTRGAWGGDLLIYFKQQIPTAAERSGAVPRDPRSPGERCAADTAALTDPQPAVSSWATLGGRSFWVGLKEPWAEELSEKGIDSEDNLLRLAAAWATVAGAAHRGRDGGEHVRARLDDRLAAELPVRTAEFVREQAEWFAALRRDPAAKEMADRAEAAIRN